MTKVAVLGTGMSPFGTWQGDSLPYVHQAIDDAVDEAGLDPGYVDEAWWASLAFGGGQLGNPAALLNTYEGLEGVAAHRVENACASGGFAVRSAVQAISSGMVEVALVVGLERMNDQPRHRRGYWLGVSGETPWERMAGATFPGVYALMASRHAHEHGTTAEHRAAVAVKNHRFAAENPKAQFQKTIDQDKALGSPTVCSPLTLYDCCGTTDGAAALVLASPQIAAEAEAEPTWITGSGAATDTLALHERESLTRLDATTHAAEAAYRQAGVEPDRIDLAEVHDCFTIAEILAIEDLGFVAKGQGGPATIEGATDQAGQVVVNPSGGLKGKGHPLGATGVGQIHELHHQLLGQAGPRQVPDAQTALAHNVGGSGATCSVHVLTGPDGGAR